MKRILSFILAFLVMSSLFSVGLSADEFEEPDVDLGVGFGKFFGIVDMAVLLGNTFF